MNHRVPNIDAHSTEVGDIRHCPSPLGKGDVASVFFWDQRGPDYSSDRKRTDACSFSLDGMASHVPWIATDSEAKGVNVFEMSRESALATDVSLGHLPFQEDEMLSWLQYPLDDSFSKSYCAEQQCDQTFASFTPQNLFQGVSSEKLSASSFSLQLMEQTDANIGVRSITKDAAMVLGAKRAAGLVAQTGAEVFDRVHTVRQTCHETSCSKFTDTALPPNDREVGPSTLDHAGRHNMMNFPFFSQRVAAMKSNFQILGASSGPSIKDRLQQPIMTQTEERLSSVEHSAAAASLTSLSSFREKSDLNERNQETDNPVQKCIDPLICHKKLGQAEVELNTFNTAIGTECLETGDVTLTSLSGASDYSTEKSAKEVSCKRKSCPAEEFECESKNSGGVASQETGSAMARASSVKRTRAAEIHNQSERRRRNKINQKMKALQELIPNANKTDKASMLDEAIEYVKMLQAQLQLMSMRTGMIVPPVMMPPGMQYLSLQQGPNTLHTHMATGVSRGVGSGFIDASNSGVGALPRPVFLGQPFPGHVYHHMAGYQPHGSPSVVREVQSHRHRDAVHKTPTSQQLQLGHLQRTASIHKADSDSRRQQQKEPQ